MDDLVHRNMIVSELLFNLFPGILLNSQDFFESAVSPNVFWVDLKDINFKDGQTKKLTLGKDQAITYSGKSNAYFKASKPFQFLGIH